MQVLTQMLTIVKKIEANVRIYDSRVFYLNKSRGLTITNLATDFKPYNVNLGQFKIICLCPSRPLSSRFSLSVELRELISSIINFINKLINQFLIFGNLILRQGAFQAAFTISSCVLEKLIILAFDIQK